MKLFSGIFLKSISAVIISCTVSCSLSKNSASSSSASSAGTSLGNDVNIVFLHHSTGGVIWDGGVSGWFENYTNSNHVNYRITETAFPKSSPYGWKNYPYDYWNIWISNAGTNEYMTEPTLEILTANYRVIIWKHCFPVGDIQPDGIADVTSETKTVSNYMLQYNALKTKMRQFTNTRFIVWTGAAKIEAETTQAEAERARYFFNWVKNTWDEPGDNIFIWDFYQLETEGGLYLKTEYSAGDSHPNSAFAQTAAPYFCRRIVDVIEGRGDISGIDGK